MYQFLLSVLLSTTVFAETPQAPVTPSGQVSLEVSSTQQVVETKQQTETQELSKDGTESSAEELTKELLFPQQPTSMESSGVQDVTYWFPREVKDAILGNVVSYGPLSLENVTMKGHLSAYGPVRMRTASARNVDIKGPVDAEQLTATTMISYGPATLATPTIEETLTVYGPLKITGGKVSTLVIFGTEVVLKDVKVDSVIFEDLGAKENSEPVTLHLEGATDIAQKIEFRGKKGQVVVNNKGIRTGEIANGIQTVAAS